MNWDVDTTKKTARTWDGYTDVCLECYPMDLNEGVSWKALDPDGDEFTAAYEPNYHPNTFETLWAAIEAAETWYAGWLAQDDGEDGDE